MKPLPARSEHDLDPLCSRAELVAYFRAAARPRHQWRVGIEHEKIAVRPDGSVVPFDGPCGIDELVRRLRSDDVSVEPGGQLELAGPPLPSSAACADRIRCHLRDVATAGRPLGIEVVAGGFHPFAARADIPWSAKPRYVTMREYLARSGRLGHDMMKRTATVQVNLDYADEQDAADKMRTVLGLTPIVTALLASSPISEGRPNGHKSYRAAVWLDTDESRCGILPFAFQPGFGFADYVDWALDVPMLFVARDGHYHAAGGLTFRRFMRDGWRRDDGSGAAVRPIRPTLDDWELHLSTLFPEARFRRYIEIRGADAAPLPHALGLGALWRGILEADDCRAEAWRLVARLSLHERQRLRCAVPRQGLSARAGKIPLRELAIELGRLAVAGLRTIPHGLEDRALLDPLLEYAAHGRCPADDMLDDHVRCGGDPRRLVGLWALSGAR